MQQVSKYVKRLLPLLTLVAVAMALSITAHAQPQYTAINAESSTYFYAPSAPIYNPYTPSPGSLVSVIETWEPLAFYNPLTNKFYPVLARNWTIQVLPNGSGVLIIYLRHDIYWFNGSATIPFTAWDVYTYFYIGVKAFKWYYPFMLPQYADEDIRVLDNYTVQFLFQTWSPTEWIYILTSQISTPYTVWKPMVEKLQSMNSSEALIFSKNVTEFVPSYWALSPYYMTFISTNTIVEKLEPMYYNGVPLLARWIEIFPFNTFNYYPEVDSVYPGGNTQDLALEIAGKANWAYVGLSGQQIQIAEQHGWINVNLYAYSIYGIDINLYNFPTNNWWLNMKFRQALAYVINRTAMVEAWGAWIIPIWISVPTEDYILYQYPEFVRSIIINYTVNWTKAAQILESAGFYKKNGQWYTPSGTPITITLMAPAGFTNQLTALSEAATELTAFGIPTKILGEDVSTYSGLIIPNGEYEAAGWFGPGVESYYSGYATWHYPWTYMYINLSLAYPFQWPNGTCTPISLVTLHIPNTTIVTCVNSTFGYINLTNLDNAFSAAAPGSYEYAMATKVLFAWWEYYQPQIMWGEKLEPQQLDPHVFDIEWAYKCSTAPTVPPPLGPANLPAQFVIEPPQQIWGVPGVSGGVWMPGPLYFGGVAPPGVIPPLAQAMLNGSLWTKYKWYADFLGISPSDFNTTCIASYFHISYTPVTTTATTTATTTTTAVSTVTTTATVTSTVTSTVASTTTAVSTVTVTKPVISTALIAGIVVIVIVIAAVAAIIAMRRR